MRTRMFMRLSVPSRNVLPSRQKCGRHDNSEASTMSSRNSNTYSDTCMLPTTMVEWRGLGEMAEWTKAAAC